MQGELIQKVIDCTENEIKTLLTPYYDREEKKKKLALLTNENASGDGFMEVFNPITQRKERLSKAHLEVDTLQEQEEIQREVKGYLLVLMEDVEERLQRIRKQWTTLQLQNKQSRILRSLVSKDKLYEYGR